MAVTEFWDDTYGVFQALEKVLIVIGVPIAAYWTYYTFAITDTQKARISYEVNLARAKNFGLQIQITCSSATLGKKRYIRGGVDVLNMGAGLVRIDVSGSEVMAVYKLEYGANGTPKLTQRVPLPFLTDLPHVNKAQGFVAQRRRYLPFSFSPNADGIYFIKFSAPVQFSKEDNALTAPVPWGASTTIAINGLNEGTCGTVGSPNS